MAIITGTEGMEYPWKGVAGKDMSSYTYANMYGGEPVYATSTISSPGGGPTFGYRRQLPGDVVNDVGRENLQGLTAERNPYAGGVEEYSNDQGTYAVSHGPSIDNPYGRNARLKGTDVQGDPLDYVQKYWGYLQQHHDPQIGLHLPGAMGVARSLQALGQPANVGMGWGDLQAGTDVRNMGYIGFNNQPNPFYYSTSQMLSDLGNPVTQGYGSIGGGLYGSYEPDSPYFSGSQLSQSAGDDITMRDTQFIDNNGNRIDDRDEPGYGTPDFDYGNPYDNILWPGGMGNQSSVMPPWLQQYSYLTPYLPYLPYIQQYTGKGGGKGGSPQGYAQGGQVYPEQETAQRLEDYGRYGDSVLVHMNPEELKGIAALSPTGSLTRNPVTGQPEAFLPMLLAPMLGSWLGTAALGGIMPGFLAGAIGSGLATTAVTGDIKRGLVSGVIGAGLGAALGGAGQSAAEAAATSGSDALASTMTDMSTALGSAGTPEAMAAAATQATGEEAAQMLAQGAMDQGGNMAAALGSAGTPEAIAQYGTPLPDATFTDRLTAPFQEGSGLMGEVMKSRTALPAMIGYGQLAEMDQQDEMEEAARIREKDIQKKKQMGYGYLQQGYAGSQPYAISGPNPYRGRMSYNTPPYVTGYAEGGAVTYAEQYKLMTKIFREGGNFQDYLNALEKLESGETPTTIKEKDSPTTTESSTQGPWGTVPLTGVSLLDGSTPTANLYGGIDPVTVQANLHGPVNAPPAGHIPGFNPEWNYFGDNPNRRVTGPKDWTQMYAGSPFGGSSGKPHFASPINNAAPLGSLEWERLPGSEPGSDQFYGTGYGGGGYPRGGGAGMGGNQPGAGMPGKGGGPNIVVNMPAAEGQDNWEMSDEAKRRLNVLNRNYEAKMEGKYGKDWASQGIPGASKPSYYDVENPYGWPNKKEEKAEGGPVGMAPQPAMPMTPEPQDLQMLAAALMGQAGEQGDQVIQMFISKYGVEAFRAARQMILQQVVPNAQTEGMVQGPGGGMDDQVMGMIGSQQGVAVSPGEYIVPADVVSGLGDGSSDAGAVELDRMSANVRRARGGSIEQPPAIDAQNIMPA